MAVGVEVGLVVGVGVVKKERLLFIEGYMGTKIEMFRLCG